MKRSTASSGGRLRIPTSLFSALASLAILSDAAPSRADSWQERSPAPGRRAAHSAVWTGREMIVWGGGVDGQFLNTGGRYDPATDTWRPTSIEGATSPRWFHAAVWAGHEMIVWGGRPNFAGNDNLSDGARYNPSTDTWTPLSNHGAPTRRSQCAAVWTGSEMIVWGGATEGGVPLADGARYNPATDTWTPLNGDSGLAPRMEPTAVWTGSEMIVFGGVDVTKPGWLSYADGARYNPATGTWAPLPPGGAPSSRTGHTAVWTGERMIVWGGRVLPAYEFLNDGAIYSPGSDSWTPVSPGGAPQARMLHAAVWTGTEMIVWGGQASQDSVYVNSGARYNPATGAWTPTTLDNAPRKRHFWRPDNGIWTGGGMLISCGSDYPTSLDATSLYRLAGGTNVPPPPTNCVSVPFGLAAWWSAEGNTRDRVGTNEGVLLGGVGYESAKVRSGFLFPTGAHGAVKFLASPTLDVGSGDGFTVEGWIRPTVLEPNTPLVEWNSGTYWGSHFHVVNGSLYANLTGPAGEWHQVFSSAPVQTGLFHHVALTYDKPSGGARLYLNGAIVAERALGSFTPQTAFDLYLGRRPAGDFVGSYAGLLDEFSLYRRALTASEIIAIHTAGAAGKCATNPPSQPPGQPTYDLSRDFSPTHNPNGPWSYGYQTTLGGAFTLLTFRQTSFGNNPVPVDSLSKNGYEPVAVYHNGTTNTSISDGGAGVFPPGTIWFYPGIEGHIDNYGVIRFTVPAGGAGTYQLATAVRAYLDGPRSGDTDFHVLKNGVELFGEFLPGNSGTSYSNRLSLAGGDTVDFAVGRGQDNIAYDSGLKIQASLVRVSTNLPPPPPPRPRCVPAPAGLVAWWPGEGTPADVAGTNHGALFGGAEYSAGRVRQGFAFDGDSSGVRVPASASLDVGAGPGLTIEGWINPADLTIRGPLVEWNRGGPEIIEWGVHLYILRPDEFGLGAGNLVANLAEPSGHPHLLMAPGGTISAHQWQHVALAYDKASGLAQLYRDGAIVAESHLGSFTPETSCDLYLGRRPAGDAILSYHGLLDEVAIYNRALQPGEIQGLFYAASAGKCLTNAPPPVLPLHRQPRICHSRRLPGGSMEWVLNGQPGISYVIESSTDLVNWSELLAITAASSATPFVDPGGSSARCCFYRVRMAQ